jgi:beta-lactamase regulating signal transducer with metallopeptidase domain
MIAADIVDRLIRVNLAAGAAIVGVIALRRMVRRPFGARLAYGLWLLPLLASAAVMVPARQVVVVRRPPPASEARLAPAPSQLHRPLAASGTQAPSPASSAGWPVRPAGAMSDDPRVLLVGLWLLGAGGGALIMAGLQQRFVRQARRGAVGPAVVGVFAPWIVTPRDFRERYNRDEQALVLAHEQAHIARQDSRMNGLCAVVQCLCWFNPLVHLAARLMRIDQELACDEAVVARFPAARRAYAEVLLKAQMATLPLPLGCYWPSRTRHPLVERVALLKQRRISSGRRWAGASALAILCTGAGLAAWAAQPANVRIAIASPVRSAEPAESSPGLTAGRDEGGSIKAIKIALNTATSTLEPSFSADTTSSGQQITVARAETAPPAPASGAVQPEPVQPAASGSTRMASVTVRGTAPPAMMEEQARGFVRSYAVAPNPEIDQIARLHDPACVQVVGLVPEQAAMVKARIESVAQAVGLRAARADCAANIEIVFADQPQRTIDIVARQREYFLGYYHLHDRDRLKTVTHPIQSWYVTSTSSFAGVVAGIGTERDFPRSLNSMPTTIMGVIDDPENQPRPGCGDAVHFTGCFESWIENVFIVADSKTLEGRDLGLVADYMAMLALSKPRSQDGCSSLVSVMDAFARSACPGRDAPDGLTAADAAYLTALYAADPGVRRAFEQADIARRMATILIKASAASTGLQPPTKAR